MSIYTSIKKPIISLAPMEDVTDSVFRQVICSVGKPDLFYTEFINVEGLNSKGKEKVIHRLKYDVVEKPIIAQLWGINPENFFKASQIVSDMGFDGIDINMGCSVQKISARGCGSGLINNTELSKEIINAVKEGSDGLPVSVKTRLGWKEYGVDSWIQFLLEQDLDVLTVHGRTARGSGVINANWDEISKCVKLRDEMGKSTLIFGNGDIKSLIQANEYVNKYGVDGVMIGRA
ncbi:TPA: dihydrouridine synthase, partial [Patescibacteria group bacterium]|nr:dihydrouridine synthase [Patescibacteria group bacterium]